MRKDSAGANLRANFGAIRWTLRKFFGFYRLVTLCTYQNNFISDRHSFYTGNVYHHHIHCNSACNRATLSPYQNIGFI